MKSLVVLLSGNGSNLQAIIDRIAQENWPLKIAAVISDKPNAYGLIRAQQANIPTHVFPSKLYPGMCEYHQALQDCIGAYQPDLIVLAGYMRILAPEFVNHFAGKIINIHPSLLPAYKGLHTHERVLEAHEKYHGTSIHIVTADLDDGPLLAQERIEIAPDDTAETLKAKVQALEHRLYPEVIYRQVIAAS